MENSVAIKKQSVENLNVFENILKQKDYLITCLSGLFLFFSFFGLLKEQLGFDPAWVTIVLSGFPILKGALAGLLTRGDIKSGVLVSLALIASVSVGEYFAAGEVAWIMMLGELIENRTVARSKEVIRQLVNLVPNVARVRRMGIDTEMPLENVMIGDIVIVRPGETIPVDGEVLSGRSAVNQSAITGESLPVEKQPGDEVYVGSLNQLGVLEIKATKVAEDTTLARVIKLVSQAEIEKAPLIRTADRWATWMVPTALLIAVGVYSFSGDLIRAVTILIVFCPCALVLATPTAITAAIGNAARKGILVKSGAALESADTINTLVFDKTGTITKGRPAVSEVRSFSFLSENDVLRLAATAEKNSEHPLARSIIRKAEKQDIRFPNPDGFHYRLGFGVEVMCGSLEITVGGRRLFEEKGINIGTEVQAYIKSREESGQIVVLVASGNELVGTLAISDMLREEAPATVQKLKKLNINDIWMISGDNNAAAMSVAGKAGITNYLAGQLPEDKVRAIRELKQLNRKVAMVGDGINDAPALALSHLGIAMGGIGTDVAIESSDVVLMSDDLNKVPQLFNLSRKTSAVIQQGIIASMLINLGAIVLASFGLLGPILGALVHNAGSVLVVANSARLINFEDKP